VTKKPETYEERKKRQDEQRKKDNEAVKRSHNLNKGKKK
jgi:hypothetical protein